MRIRLSLAVLSLALGLAQQSSAGLINGELWMNAGAAGNATIANQPITAPDAMFTTLDLNYHSGSQPNGYTIGGFLKNPTFTNTSGAFNPAASVNNTYFLFTGQTYLNAGANSFVVGHDDGVELFITGIGTVVTTPGLTGFVDTPFNVNAPSAGFYAFTLAYGEAAGPPADLVFQINGGPVGTAVPEPSTLLTAGMASVMGLFAAAKRSRRK